MNVDGIVIMFFSFWVGNIVNGLYIGDFVEEDVILF